MLFNLPNISADTGNQPWRIAEQCSQELEKTICFSTCQMPADVTQRRMLSPFQHLSVHEGTHEYVIQEVFTHWKILYGNQFHVKCDMCKPLLK